MKPAHWLCVFASLVCFGPAASAQVKITRETGKIAIVVDGKPFGDFYVSKDYAKPFVWPMRSASGVAITRGFPMEPAGSGSHDHPHQRGMFFAHEDVNKTDFWNNEFTYKTHNRGVIALDRIEETKGGKRSGVIHTTFNWRDPQGNTLVVEDRRMTFYADPSNRIVDVDITLTAKTKVVFGDAKDGGFGIRLADKLTELRGTGKMVDADGAVGEKQIWGHRSNWVDYSGELEGQKVGVAIFDHPSNPRHPNRWHARGYGLFAINPFGNHVFDKSAPVEPTPLDPGQSLHYRWRVVIHPGDTASANIASLWDAYAKTK